MNENLLPAGAVRVSRFCGFATHKTNPAQPVHMVYHALSGDVLKTSLETSGFLRSLSGLKRISRAELLGAVDKESLPTLRLFFDKKLLVPAGPADEMSEYLEKYPVARGIVSYRNKAGQRCLVLSTPGPFGQNKTQEFFPDDFTSAFLGLCDGEFRLGTILEKLSRRFGSTKAETKKRVWRLILDELTLPQRQILKLLPEPFSQLRKQGLGAGLFRSPIADFTHNDSALQIKASARDKDGTTDLKEFHKAHIQDAFHEFDSVETTVSHAFRNPSAALNGLSYGASFFDAVQRHYSIPRGASIVEVGGGTGVFANEFLKRAHEKQPKAAHLLRYRILDIAPALQKSQAELNREFSGQLKFSKMDAEALKLAKPADLILCNEVVADLRTVQIHKRLLQKFLRAPKKRRSKDPVALSMYLFQKFEIPFADAPELFYFNLGTALFLEKIRENIKKGGAAVVTEFGSVASYPTCTFHLNHDEYSIHWGQMTFLAKQLGFSQVELLDLPSFLPFHPFTEMFAGDFEEIRHIFGKYRQTAPPMAAYDRAELEKIVSSLPQAQIQGLEFLPLHAEGAWGPSPWEFKALVLRG